MIDFLRNIVVRDFWLKLLSLVFAVFIWLTVSKVVLKSDRSPLTAFAGHAVEKTYVNVPIMVIFPAAEIRDVRVEPSEVQVTVSGSRQIMDRLKDEDVRAQVDLSGIESARALRKSIEIILPPGLTYTRIDPVDVEVILPPKN